MLNKNNIKKIKRKIILLFMPRIAWAVVWLLYFSCKNKFYINDDIKKGNAILAFWHGEILMLPFLYKKMRDKPKILIITSEHFDGELITNLYKYYDFKSIRGSSTRGGRRVLLQAIDGLKNGYDIAITPDGPQGPYHSIADGIVAMSQKTGMKIIVVKTIPSRFWELKSWDRFRIPKPFSTIKYISAQGFSVDKNLSLQEAKDLIYKQMTKDENELI